MADLLPIKLNAKSNNWRYFDSRRRNTKFLILKKRVLQRDNSSCRYCGFFSKEYLEVVNIDQNYRNNKLENLATSCSFCWQCTFLDAVGAVPNTGGILIHLPEVSQADLNNFCRILFCSLEKDSPYKSKLQSVYMSFKDRSKEVVDCFGPNTSDPRVFAQGMLDANLQEEHFEHEVLKHLKLLPIKHPFTEQIQYWQKTIFANVPI